MSPPHTVLHNMLVGMMLIFLVQWLFLGDLRSAVIVGHDHSLRAAVRRPIMMLRGESANLLSVGAIDFGLVVDATVIMMENIFRHLSGRSLRARRAREPARAGAKPRACTANSPPSPIAAQEVNQPIFFSAAIIVAGFMPLFTMTRRGRPYFRADGAHLCLCHRRRR